MVQLSVGCRASRGRASAPNNRLVLRSRLVALTESLRRLPEPHHLLLRVVKHQRQEGRRSHLAAAESLKRAGCVPLAVEDCLRGRARRLRSENSD